MSLPRHAPTIPGAGQCSSKPLREQGGGIEGKAGRTRLVVVELLTGYKPILSFFLGFFLLQQHLMMQMRKRRRRMAPATATVMSAHLGTWSDVQGVELDRRVKTKQNIQSTFKPLPGASALGSCTFKSAPRILDRPHAARLWLKTIPQMGSKDILCS